ncbi:MAG: hypothetical protein JW939_05305 [Candidatus Thermoplasmatota archaeon]|nr:hypothetical protein [Candidatus Thermoplasmatota archaeon]
MMQEEVIEEGEGRKGFLSWIRSAFGRSGEEPEEQEPPQYKRRLLDGRIEKYLDQNMSAYIEEYGILTGLDIEAYDMRYEQITGRISSMKEFMLSADARISNMERDIDLIGKAAKGGK